jgi:UDPglucose 6-dehydrogenase
MNISVFGTGYVGLVTGIAFAEMGHSVTCVDVDEKKIQILKDGVSPIYESGLEDLLKKNLLQQKINFTTKAKGSVENADVIFVAVGTPQDDLQKINLNFLMTAIDEISNSANGYKLIIIKSTVPIGTNKKIKSILTKKIKDFDLVYNPEFLREGCAIQDCLNPDRIIIGLDNLRAEKSLRSLYEPLLKKQTQFFVMNYASAEMTKYAANAMLATRISFMNEISKLSEKAGANMDHIRLGIGSDHRIGPYFLNAGIGYGGSCFPKDLVALTQFAKEVGEESLTLQAVQAVNSNQKRMFIKKIEDYFNGNLKGKHFAIWGLAFKPGTDDIRESPAISIVTGLLKAGAGVSVFDPAAMDNAKKFFNSLNSEFNLSRLKFAKDQYAVLEEDLLNGRPDALILLTEWKIFSAPDFNMIKSKMNAPVIFDGRNCYEPSEMKGQGFKYFSIGRDS